MGPGGQMTCQASAPTYVTTRGLVWCKSTDGNRLYYTDPSGASTAVGGDTLAIFNAKSFGAVGSNGVADDTTAINACTAAAHAVNGTCYLPNGIYGITNVTMYAYSTLLGSSMGQGTILKRIVGATGTAIRERTSAEGNSSGAGGLWIRNIYLDGNATVGDGINLGNQVVSNQLNFNSGLDNVHVRNFTSGVGMIINQNAAKVTYVWSNSNATGIKTQGGGSFYDGIWAEGNTTLNLQVQGADDTFNHVHVEQAGTGAPATGLMKVEGSQNRFYGVSLVQTSNITQAVYIASGAVRNSFYGTMLNTNGFTFSNVFFVQAWASGTGAVDFEIPLWIDNAGGLNSYIINQSDNASLKLGPMLGEPLGADIASATTIAPTTSFVRITGTTAIATITPPASCSGGTVCCFDAVPTGLWTTTAAGNIIKASTAVVGQTMRFCYNPNVSKWSSSY